jgi:hypothetical protein
MRGREAIEGHDTIALALTPRPQAKPRTHEGKQMQKFSLRAWISESDHELVRLDAEAIDTLSMGFGVLARLDKGSQLSFLRRRVNNEVWLPAAVHFSGGTRVALVRTLRRSGTSELGLPQVRRRHRHDVSGRRRNDVVESAIRGTAKLLSLRSGLQQPLKPQPIPNLALHESTGKPYWRMPNPCLPFA